VSPFLLTATEITHARLSRSRCEIATVYALRKDPEKMLELLEHGWRTHNAGVTDLLLNPFMLAYKDDPRFIAFAQKIGVMPKTAPKP